MVVDIDSAGLMRAKESTFGPTERVFISLFLKVRESSYSTTSAVHLSRTLNCGL